MLRSGVSGYEKCSYYCVVDLMSNIKFKRMKIDYLVFKLKLGYI